MEGGGEVGFLMDAARNMSCQGGVVVEDGSFGSEYGTSSILGLSIEFSFCSINFLFGKMLGF